MEQINPITELQELKVTYSCKPLKKPITSSEQAYEICKQAYFLSDANISLREYFFIILLNRANKVLGYYQLSSGGVTGTVADPKLAFSIALKCLASSVILTHCHPSQNKQPSESDRQLTKKFKAAGELLDINVLDHLIITKEDYFSFADHGQI